MQKYRVIDCLSSSPQPDAKVPVDTGATDLNSATCSKYKDINGRETSSC